MGNGAAGEARVRRGLTRGRAAIFVGTVLGVVGVWAILLALGDDPKAGAPTPTTAAPSATSTSTAPPTTHVRGPLDDVLESLLAIEFVDDGLAFGATCDRERMDTDVDYCPVTLLRSADSGATWEIAARLEDAVPDEYPADVQVRFANRQDGWVRLGSRVLATHDGGMSWEWNGRAGLTSQRLLLDGQRVLVIGQCSRNEDTALACVGVDEAPVAGGPWRAASPPAFPTSGASRGEPLAPGLMMLLETADDGLRWFAFMPPCLGESRGGPSALNRTTLWYTCVGEPGGSQAHVEIYRSHDAGHAWRLVGRDDIGGEGPPVGRVPNFYIKAEVAPNGYLFGSGRIGGVTRSTDGGATWAGVHGGGDERLAFDWIDKRLGFASSRYQIARTRDGGASWEVVAGS